MDDSKNCPKLRRRGSFPACLDRVEGGLEGGAQADAELEEEEGDDGPHEDGLRAPRLQRCLWTPPIAWDGGRLTHPSASSLQSWAHLKFYALNLQ